MLCLLTVLVGFCLLIPQFQAPGPTVFGIVAATPENIDDLEMKKVILRKFSDIATPTEAVQKLRNMNMTSDQPIASYNYNYAAVHEAAFDINPLE